MTIATVGGGGPVGDRAVGRGGFATENLARRVGYAVPCAVVDVLRQPFDGDHGAATKLAQHDQKLGLFLFQCLHGGGDGVEVRARNDPRHHRSARDDHAVDGLGSELGGVCRGVGVWAESRYENLRHAVPPFREDSTY